MNVLDASSLSGTARAALSQYDTATVPFAEQQTTTYDLPVGAPDIHHGGDALVPTRITLRYTQLATSAIPQNIEVTVKGLFRNPDGTVSRLGGSFEVWRYVADGERAAWVAVLVNENLPSWWTA